MGSAPGDCGGISRCAGQAIRPVQLPTRAKGCEYRGTGLLHVLNGHGRRPGQSPLRAADGEVQLLGFPVHCYGRLPLPGGEDDISSDLLWARGLLFDEKRHRGASNVVRVRRQPDSTCVIQAISDTRPGQTRKLLRVEMWCSLFVMVYRQKAVCVATPWFSGA